MDKWIIYTFSTYSYPKLQIEEVEANDIQQAIQCSNIDLNSIVCIKIKAPISFDDK